MSIKVKPTIKRFDDEIDEHVICPEAMNDPDNLAMRRNNDDRKFVKDYDTIKKELDRIKRESDKLEDNWSASCYRTRMDKLTIAEVVLRWVLRDDNSNLSL